MPLNKYKEALHIRAQTRAAFTRASVQIVHRHKLKAPPKHFFVKFSIANFMNGAVTGVRTEGRTDRQIQQMFTFIPQVREGVRKQSKFQYRYIKQSLWLSNSPPYNGCFTATRPTSLRLCNTRVRGLILMTSRAAVSHTLRQSVLRKRNLKGQCMWLVQ